MKVILASQLLASFNASNEAKMPLSAYNRTIKVEKEFKETNLNDCCPFHVKVEEIELELTSEDDYYYDYLERDNPFNFTDSYHNLREMKVEQGWVGLDSHRAKHLAAGDGMSLSAQNYYPRAVERMTGNFGEGLDPRLPQLIIKNKVPVKVSSGKRKIYSKDIKDAVLRMFFQEQYDRMKISRITNVPYPTVKTWVRKGKSDHTSKKIITEEKAKKVSRKRCRK